MDDQSIGAKLGIPIVQKQQGNYELVGLFNSVQKRKGNIDKEYESRIDRMASMLNHDRTVFTSQIMDVGPDGAHELGGVRPLRLLQTTFDNVMPTVQVFSNIDYDRNKLSQSSQQRDRLKTRAIERIDAEFAEALGEAEASGDSTKVSQINHRKNLAWSVIKEDIDGSDWKKIRPKQIQSTVDQVLSMSNNFSSMEEHNIFREINSTFKGNPQVQMEKFKDFTQGSKFFTYDIETIGNALDSERFSVSEIAMQGFDNVNGEFVQSDDRFTRLVRMRPEEVTTMSNIIAGLQKDGQTFNALDHWQQRTALDLMRYSTKGEIKADLRNLVHNGVIKNVFDEREKIKTSYVVNNMEEMLTHMKSGLANLQNEDYTYTATAVVKDFNQYVAQRGDHYFVGHNSDNFDNPKLQQWASLEGQTLNIPKKSMDFMSVVQTLYPNATKLHEELRAQNGVGEMNFLKGMTTLGELQRSIGLDTLNKHSALADIGEDGLGGVLAKSMNTISKHMDESEMYVDTGLNKSTEFSWSSEPIRTGQQVFSAGGFQAYADGELSFAATFNNETGEFNPTSSGYNNTVVNSKAFYQVHGIRDFSKDGRNVQALQLYNELDDKYAFVVREGDDAMDQLASFMQKRFYNWDGLTKEAQKTIYDNHLQDNARRRYDRMFSLEKAGGGVTGGFEAAKRTFSNADLLQKRIDGKSKNIKENFDEALPNRAAFTNDEMHKQMNFDSLWNPKTKSWDHNESEKKEFFAMRKRILSEREHFNPAIKKIESHFAGELEDAIAEGKQTGTRHKEFEVRKRRDMAWLLYSNRIKEQIGADLPMDKVRLEQFENSLVHVNDGDLTPKQLNLFDYGTARKSINKYAYSGLNDLPQDTKNKLARERLVRMVKNLADQSIVNQGAKNQMLDIITSNVEAGNASNQISDFLISNSNSIDFEKFRMQPSLGFNNGIKKIGSSLNERLVEDAISQIEDITAVKLNNTDQPGAKIRFGDRVNEVLDELDTTERLSGLKANNRQAVEDVLSNLLDNEYFKGMHYAVSIDKKNANLKISAYKSDASASVVSKLTRGENADNALNILLPLVNQNGTHVVGNRVLNARTIADYEDGKVVMKSTSQIIGEDYKKVLSRALVSFNQGDVEGAQNIVRRQLNSSISELSGIQRSLSSGDQDFWNNNLNDMIKQSQIEIESAMIKEKYGKELTEKDFSNPSDVFDKNGDFKRRVGFDDLYPESSYGLSLKMGEWMNEQGIKAFTSSVKADHVSQGRVAGIDVRELIPYGDYIFQGRDNSVQFMNAHLLEPEVMERMKSTGRYVNFDPAVTTDKQKAFQNEWSGQAGNEGKAIGADVKVAYMNDDDVLKRLETMKESHRDLLTSEGILNDDGTWNKVRMPRIYEQQGLVAKDFAEAVSVNEQKVFSGVTLSSYYQNRLDNNKDMIIQPGETIGYKNGSEVRWNKTQPGTIQMQNGEPMVKWQESPFKWSLSGEKATDFRVSPELMEAITGSADTTFVINPNVAKHKDFGMVMAGKANLIGQYMRGQHDLLDEANADKASALGQKRGMIQQHIDDVASKAKTLGLEWNAEDKTFYERTRQMSEPKIAMKAFDDVMSELGIDHTTTAADGSKFETGILTAHANKVSNYSKVVDNTGRRVLNVNDDGTRVYDETGRSGVKWGHRELAVLKDLKMGDTYNAVMKQIMDQAQDQDAYAKNNPGFKEKQVNRLQEMHNTVTALASLKDENYIHSANVGSLTLDAFADLPDIERDNHTLMNTVFDQDHVLNKLGASHHDNLHGYWLELPGTKENGVERNVGVNTAGANAPQAQKNKIFIPFTNMEGADGQVQYRDLQRNIADIYEKAKAVDQSKDSKLRSSAMDELQTSVDKYIGRLVTDVSSSKGQTGQAVVKAVMPNSATGLFKLMDPNTSKDIDGEHTFISEHDARALGDDLFEKLKRGDDVFTMNVRYPTFHKNAMQISKLKMDASIRPGEFHTTSLMSSLMKADSDGDYDNIVTMQDEKVQKEWERKYNQQMQARDEAYDAHIKKDYSPDRKFDSNSISPDVLSPNPINSQDEIAAKIGKRIIGSASNLNYSMSQMARSYLTDNQEQREAILKFGQNIEQKLISSKHGGTVAGGEAPAIDFIKSIYNNDQAAAMRLHNEFKEAGTEIVDEDTFKKAFQGLDTIQRRSAEHLRTDMLKFGTSYGVSSKNGINNVVDMLMGNVPIDEAVESNGFINVLREAMGVEVQGPSRQESTRPSVDPYKSLEQEPAAPKDRSIAGFAGDVTEDALGGWESAGQKVRNLAHKIGGNPIAKWGTIGGALALGGLAGYNVLSHDDPLAPPDLAPEEQTPANRRAMSPLPPLDSGNALQQNANVSISATGSSKQSSGQLSQMVNEGMKQSGMNAGPTRVTVNQQDNTQKLNRIWYRDKVEQNI